MDCNVLPTVDCAAKLVECGYSKLTATEMTNVSIRRGIIPSKIVTTTQMCAMLRAISGTQKKRRCQEGCRKVLAALEEAAVSQLSAFAYAPSPPYGARNSAASAETPNADIEYLTLKLEPEPDEPVRARVCERLLDHLGASEPEPDEPAAHGDDVPDIEPDEPDAGGERASMPQEQGLGVPVSTETTDVLAQLTDADAAQIRKTTETSPRVSIYDVIERAFGLTQPRQAWHDLKISHPEVHGLTSIFKFPGQGQRETPVSDARGIVRIIMLLPCRAVAPVRAKAANVLVRYLGGDPDIVRQMFLGEEAERLVANPPPPEALPQESGLYGLAELTDADVSRIRKTNETPPRVSVYDVFQQLFRIGASDTSKTFARLLESFPELREADNPAWISWKFPGERQRETPVTDARGIVRIIMLLPCRAAAPVRAKAADVLVRYLGGDPSLVRARVCERLLDHLRASEPEPDEPDIEPDEPDAGGERASMPQEEGLGVPVSTETIDVLAQLTDADTAQIRKTSESPPRVSVFDVITSFLRAGNPWQMWGDFSRQFPEVLQLVEDFKFPGRGQRNTPVTDARGIVRIIMMLPCRAAAPLRAKAADVLVRYLGGDPSLVPEIAQNRIVQESIEQTHAARLFGETVESESRVPPPPQEFHEAPQLEGAAHLYALASQVHPRLFKTGSSKDPWERLQSEDRKHQGRLKLALVAVWWHEAHLEHLARRHLLEMPAEELAIQGTEYRMTSLKEIKDATDAARLRYRGLANPRPQGPDEETEARCKRRRLCLQVRREEFEMARMELALDEQRLALDEQTFDLEKRRSSWTYSAQMLAGSPTGNL